MALTRLVLGIIILILGRKLFWFFIGVLGFIAGSTYGPRLFPGLPVWLLVLVSVLAGLAGALLAIFLQKIAVGLAGFIAGGYLAMGSLEWLGLNLGPFSWLPFVIGGILGGVLVAVLFDWALMILSSLTGAGLIAPILSSDPSISALIFIALWILGLIIQARLLTR